MEVINVTTREQLKYLYQHSALTWEGLREESFDEAFNDCSMSGAKAFCTKGKVMNKLCKLTGDNAYPDDLNIFSIDKPKVIAIFVGGRWMDDIVDNNANREDYHPFGGSHYDAGSEYEGDDPDEDLIDMDCIKT